MFNSGLRGKRAPDGYGTVTNQSQFIQQQDPQPSITGWNISGGVDDTALNPSGGQTVIVNGSGFASGAAVTVDGQTISPVTVISSTQLSFTAPAKSGGSYTLIVYNSTGGAAILVPGLVYSSVPTYSTAAGSIGTLYETTSINTSVVATSDSAITYSLVSGSLPAGATFNANGTITGTSPVESGSTTYTFAIKAEDAELQDVTRTFTLTINTDVVTWSSPADNTTYTSNSNVALANVSLIATSAAGYGITYTANSLPTGLSLTGNTISGTPTVIANSSTLLTATASTTNRTATRTINWVIRIANDTYFNLTKLLLNGETNYWIRDASTNKFAMTVTNDVRPLAFSPYETVWSNLFDGSTSYISTPANSAFSFGTGDFTIECWVRTSDWSLEGAGYSRSIMTIGDLTFYLRINQYHGGTNGALRVAGLLDGSTVALTDGVWHHIAVVRQSNIVRYWIDGVYQTEASGSSVTTNFSNTITNVIGAQSNPIDGNFNGYISNVRVVKGTAVYTGTSNFRPITSPLTAISGTSLLTCRSNRLIDNSTNNFTITRNGDVRVSNFGPFVETDLITGSGYFDGTGDYLTYTYGSELAFGTGVFTVEFWMYSTTTNLGILQGVTNAGWGIAIVSGTFYWQSVVNQANLLITNVSAYLTATWRHWALVRSSGTLSLYIDGQLITSVSDSTNYSSASGTFYIGYYPAVGSVVNGYLSNLRIVKGTAVYTANFTPPTSPLTAISGTSLLTLQNRFGENNNRFIDTSGLNHVVTKFGNATQGTFSPFSQTGWSTYYTGVADTNGTYLDANAAYSFGTGDFTVEAWVNIPPIANTNGKALLDSRPNATNGSYWFFGLSNTGQINFNTMTTGGTSLTSPSPIPTNQWVHLAFTRASGTLNLWVNGVSVASASGNTNNISSDTIWIGRNAFSGVASDTWFAGNMSNVRIVKGVAVYTGTFTPPTGALQATQSAGANISAITGSQTSLLIHQSNRFIDNSSIGATIKTLNTWPSVQAFSPFAPAIITPTSYSGYFDGTGDYLDISNVPTNFGSSSNFTIEFWMYPTVIDSTIKAIFDPRTSDASAHPLIWINASNRLYYFTTNAARITGTTTLTANKWYHVALVRNSGTTTLYLDGVVEGTPWSDTVDYLTSTTFRIGQRYAATAYNYGGYLSNLRIVNGTAVYTSSFTPPTSPLTAISGTSLLTCQSNRFIDNSTNNFAITVNGNTIPRQFNPFGNTSLTGENAAYSVVNVGGSMYFDGNSDYLSVGNNTDAFNCGTSNFTLDFWFYDDGTSTSYPSIFSSTDWATGVGGVSIRYNNTGQANKFLVAKYAGNGTPNGGSGTNELMRTTNTYPTKTWHHVAFVRNGNNFRIYVNGVLDGQTTSTESIDWNLSSAGPRIGGGNWDGANSYIKGWISDLRLIKGVALYTSAFSPPTTPLNAINGTTLLLNGTNSGIIDQTGKNVLETVGVQLSTTITKFGNASMYFDGSGDYIVVPGSSYFDFGAGNFTLEFWMYPLTLSGTQVILDAWNNTPTRFLVRTNGTSLQFYASPSNTSYSLPAANAWYHVACVRNGSTFTLYVDGVSRGTFSSANAITASTNFWTISRSAETYNGYLDDIRITKGYARYTSNFTPPTTTFIGI
jgi:hypothetical protein